MPFFDYFCIQKHNYYIMRRILYFCIFILSLLPIERLAAQRSITVYDPETNMPVRGFHIRTDQERTDTTNIFGSVALPEKFDTLLLTKPGYIALRIPSKLVKDTIPVIKDYNNIGEVVVYGNRQNEFQEAVKRWAKADKTEMELRHPITGIEFNLSDILNAKRRHDKRNAKKMAKLFNRMDATDDDPIIHSYRRALQIESKH